MPNDLRVRLLEVLSLVELGCYLSARVKLKEILKDNNASLVY